MNIFSLIYLISAIVSFILAVFFFIKKKSNGHVYLAAIDLVAGLWALSYSFEMMASTPGSKEIFAQFAYLGIATAPILFLAFALDFTQNQKSLTKKNFILLSIIPALGMIIVFTNQIHHWYWPSIVIEPLTNIGVFEHGIPFFVFLFYMYLILTAAIAVIFLGLYRFTVVFKGQLIILIIAPMLPFIANAMYVTNINPIPNIDWTPISFTLSTAIVSFGIFRYKLFDLMPIARHKVIESINDSVLVFDSQERVILANKSFYKTFFPDNRDLTGTHFTEIDKILHMEPSQSESSEIRITEFPYNKLIFEIQEIPLIDKQKNSSGKVFVFHDITLLKQTENTLKNINKKLNKEIRQHEHLVSDLSSFSSSVAHDLKNPISSIVLISELLQDTMENDPKMTKRLLQELNTRGNKMVQIVDELLKLAYVSTHSIEYDQVNMGEVIESVVVRLSMMIKEHKAQVIFPEKWPPITSYGPWIEEVWANFISNALKYGGIPPVITLGFDHVDNNKIKFWIQDNGLGLSESEMEKLFIEFERLDTQNAEGHGLGLSLIKRIITKLEGTVKVESNNTPGEGCLFSFTIPTKITNGDE